MEPGPGDSGWPDAGRRDAVSLDSRALVRMSQEARARARTTREKISQGRSQWQLLHDSAYARLLAQLETMPVIEQAKGIIMARQRCGPGEAIDLLRKASQRANVRLHVLAVQMVEQVASGDDGGNVPPSRRVPRGTCGRARRRGRLSGDADQTLRSTVA